MTQDVADKIALGIYGKTGRANAPENQNPDFQAGYNVGTEAEDSFGAVRQEWIRIGKPDELPASFLEWKRGLWAALMQKAVAQSSISASRGDK